MQDFFNAADATKFHKIASLRMDLQHFCCNRILTSQSECKCTLFLFKKENSFDRDKTAWKMNKQDKYQLISFYRQKAKWDSRDLGPVLYGACGMHHVITCFMTGVMPPKWIKFNPVIFFFSLKQ